MIVDPIQRVLNSAGVDIDSPKKEFKTPDIIPIDSNYEFAKELVEEIIEDASSEVEAGNVIIANMNSDAPLIYLQAKIELLRDEIKLKLEKMELIPEDLIKQYNKYNVIFSYISLRIQSR